jgi:hemerythrin-like metal-binding protein
MADSAELTWSDELLLGHPAMDHTHREFVDVVQAMTACADADLAAGLRRFIAHAQAHFGEEDRDMAETRFPAADCHADEHAAVLSSAHEVLARVEAGDVPIGRAFVAELSRWFPSHVAHLDSALAHWLVKRRHGGAPVVLRRELARA